MFRAYQKALYYYTNSRGFCQVVFPKKSKKIRKIKKKFRGSLVAGAMGMVYWA